MFWRKLILLNLGLFIVIFRLYGLIIDKIDKKSNDVSIFPIFDEGGYPFYEQIDCNLKNTFIINYYLYDNYNKNNSNINNLNVINNNKYFCDFYNQLQICKGNKNCIKNIFDSNTNCNYNFNLNLYHNDDNFIGNFFWESIYNLNYFSNKKTMDFLYKIISGYQSYIHLSLFTNSFNLNNTDEYDYIKNKLTNNYEFLNNLFFLENLLFKSSLKLQNKNLIINLNNTNLTEDFINNHCDECINQINSFDYENFDKNFINETFNIISNIKNILNCIGNDFYISKESSIIDFNAFETMFKILFYNLSKINDKKEEENFIFFVNNFIKNVGSIFIIDYKLKIQSYKYKEYSIYLFILFWGFAITTLLFVNRYFIKNKAYYGRPSQLISNKKFRWRYADPKKDKNLFNNENNNQKKTIENIKDMSSKENKEKYSNDLNKYSQEDLEYIEKLTKLNGGKNSEFIITKN